VAQRLSRVHPAIRLRQWRFVEMHAGWSRRPEPCRAQYTAAYRLLAGHDKVYLDVVKRGVASQVVAIDREW